MRRPGYLGNNDKPATVHTPKAVAKEQAQLGKPVVEKPKKVDFPPGLVVSEAAKSKLNKHQAEAEAHAVKRAELKQAQSNRWGNRPEILAKWEAQDALRAERRKRLWAKWEAKDQERIQRRQAIVAKLKAQGASAQAIQEQEQKLAQEDTSAALEQAAEVMTLEKVEADEVQKQESNQVVKDKTYNFFGRFLGWKLREIPQI